MSRSIRLTAAAHFLCQALAVPVALLTLVSTASSTERPNIVLIMTDDK